MKKISAVLFCLCTLAAAPNAYANTIYDLDALPGGDGTVTGFFDFPDTLTGTSISITDANDFTLNYAPDVGAPIGFALNPFGTVTFDGSFGDSVLNPLSGSWSARHDASIDLTLLVPIWDVEDGGVPIDIGDGWRLVKRSTALSEPPTFALLAIGLGAIWWSRRHGSQRYNVSF